MKGALFQRAQKGRGSVGAGALGEDEDVLAGALDKVDGGGEDLDGLGWVSAVKENGAGKNHWRIRLR